jgi:disulfide bond formation protein DsbB
MSVAEHGRAVFEQTCSICHGSNGLGKPSLGKSLVHSDYFADHSDTAMLAFLHAGRAANDPLNTTKVTMPPKGGNDALNDQDLAAAVSYVRGLQDPRRMPVLPPWVPPTIQVTKADTDAALAAAGGDAELAEYIAHGTKIFNSVCIACHGPGGVGVQGNGKALVKNEFIRGQSEDQLLEFIQKGRDPGDPKNTTGVGMPAKGGNPALSEDDLLDVIAYLRTLQGEPSGAPQEVK